MNTYRMTRTEAKEIITRELRGLHDTEPIDGWDATTFDALTRKLSYWLDTDLNVADLMEAYDLYDLAYRIEHGWHAGVRENRARTEGNFLDMLDRAEGNLAHQLNTLTSAWSFRADREMSVAA